MKDTANIKSGSKSFFVYVERDERGMYAAECPTLSGCYSQGKTKEQAIENLREVIEMCLEEDKGKGIHEEQETSFHTVQVALS